jgi:hypothetical protein
MFGALLGAIIGWGVYELYKKMDVKITEQRKWESNK